MILSYPDAGVCITAWRERENPESKARGVLYDPFRVLFASRFVVLETWTKAAYNGRREEVAYDESLFALVTQWVPNDDTFLERAIELASTHDIMNLDALHVAAAERAGVQEFVTAEKPGNPLCRAAQIRPVFLAYL